MGQLMSPKPYPYRSTLRYVAVLLVLGLCYAGYILWNEPRMWHRAQSHLTTSFDPTHPIKKLMIDAQYEHENIIQTKRTYDLKTTAERYRQLRGRHPPPGFDKWVEAALAADAIIVEEYFDRIYKDIAPFWGLDAKKLATRAAGAEFVVKVRNGVVDMQGLDKDRVPWQQLWGGLVGEFAEHMPDVDMPINMMDEPRIIVPHQKISAL
ncbi:hypothetical protein NLG97_g9525 [Lecanicillium saksenae]|uniref:Uncharacterized protein n=1 Tax=Lecanicillium saksenae TaxID=468837 RepID=A0ACC1QJ39_9HYPO|nr:hypothetical protein NLG97_g9525 [Lecanicillium saksenae]